jgi:O-antigen/teichoic acid export membrane protein
MTYVRAYQSVDPPSGESAELYLWRVAIGVSLLTGIFGTVAWYFWLANWLALNRSFAFVLGLGVVLTISSVMAQVRARLNNRYARLSIATVLAGVISLGLSVAAAMWWRRDAIPLLLAVIVTFTVILVVLGTPKIHLLIRRSELHSAQKVGLIKIGIAGIVTAPMYWIMSSSDRWFLGYYQGADAAGVYTIGFNVAAVGLMVNAAILSVWLPEASREYERDKEVARTELGRLMSRLVVGLALTWLAVTAAGGDLVRWLSDERFHAASAYVPYIAAGVFFYGVMHLSNVGLLLSKQMKWAAAWWLFGGVFCVSVNLILVPLFGGLGAAVTQAISFALMATGILATSQRIYRMELDWRRLGVTAFLVVPIGAGMSPSWHAIPVLSLLMKLPVGILATVLVAWLAAADWFRRGLDAIRRMLTFS